jgi:anti-anti-sigma factor
MKQHLVDLTLKLTFEEDLISTTVKPLLLKSREAIAGASEASTLLIDLSQVEMIDSQGLNFLIGLYQEAEKAAKSFRVTGASPANQRLFSFVNLKERFGIE